MRALRLWRFWEWSLGAKLGLTFFIVVAGVATLVSISVISRGRLAADGELRSRGINLAQNLTRLSVDSVLQDDLWGLYKIVRDIATAYGDSANVVAYAMVLDPTGRVLAHSDPARHPMGEPLSPDPVGWKRRQLADVSVLSTEVRGQETIHDVAAPILVDKQLIGVARVGLTTRHLDATIARMTRDVLLISSALGAFGVLLGFVISRRMTRPLRDLGHALDRIGEGRLHEAAVVTTKEKDEIGRLADQFNRMAERLRENIGEIEATKQYLENLLENANDFIYTLDLNGRITYVNHQFLELGLRKDDLVGRPLDALVIRPGSATAEETHRVREVQVKSADGQLRTLVLSESRLFDDDRRAIGTLGIAKDVSERKDLQERLIKSERLASVGELAGSLAHEIRNPLGALFAAAKMLVAQSPQAAEYDRTALLNVVTTEAKQLNAILTDFLQFARPRAPRLLPHSLNDVVGEVVGSIRLDDSLSNKTVHTMLDPDLPKIPIDADQIRQVLWNVLRNAVEAIGRGGEVRVITAVGAGEVVVEVTDTGPGIDSQQQARLFEPFHSTKAHGSGLGLAIAHRIVGAHSGTIDVVSTQGAGTRVRIALPSQAAA